MDHFRNRWCTRFGLWAVVTNSVLTGFLISYINSSRSLYTAVWVGILTPKFDHVKSPDLNITLRIIPYSHKGQNSRIWPTRPFLWSLSLSCQTPKVRSLYSLPTLHLCIYCSLYLGCLPHLSLLWGLFFMNSESFPYLLHLHLIEWDSSLSYVLLWQS